MKPAYLLNPRNLCLIVTALLLSGATSARADDPNPKDVLKKADAAIKQVKGVTYFGEVRAESKGERPKTIIKGKVRTRRATDDETITPDAAELGAPARLTCTYAIPRSFDEGSVDVAFNGHDVTVVDKETKTYMIGNVVDGGQYLYNVRQIFMREFVSADPFGEEIAGKSLDYKGEDKIGGVECDGVRVVYKNDMEAIWWIGKKDHLPRRVERMQKEPAGAKFVLTVKKLEVDPEFKDSTFKPRPKGYTRRDMFPPSNPNLLAAGSKAPNWKLDTPEERSVSLKSLRGNVVVMDFWATWCGPCKMAMPGVQKLHEKYKDKPVKIFGINCMERDGDPVEYMKSKNYTYGLLVKADQVAQEYLVHGIPTFYIIDQQGEIVFAESGFSPDAEKLFESIIDKLLKRPQTADSNEKSSKKKSPDEKPKKKDKTKAA